MDDSSSVGALNDFNFVHFMKFLSNNNVLATAIAAVLSERISDVTNSVVDNILMAIINRDGDGDGKSDIDELQNRTVVISGMKFGVGKVLISLIKFIIITYMIFMLTRAMDKLSTDKYSL